MAQTCTFIHGDAEAGLTTAFVIEARLGSGCLTAPPASLKPVVMKGKGKAMSAGGEEWSRGKGSKGLDQRGAKGKGEHGGKGLGSATGIGRGHKVPVPGCKDSIVSGGKRPGSFQLGGGTWKRSKIEAPIPGETAFIS
eukprot:SAG31_NODE_1009_length_10404_cov_27.639981_5_plen_138_part_00